MGKLFFWKNWEKSERLLYLIGLIVFMGALVFFLVSYFLENSVIEWIVVSQSLPIQVIGNVVELGPVSLKSYADNYLITEYFEGGALAINKQSVYIFAFFIAICIAIYQGIITTLKQYWYIFGTVIFVLMLMSFQLDQLMLFGKYQNISLYILLGVYLPLSYYFQAFSEASLWKRILVFLVITLALGIGIIQFSQVENPMLFVVNYGIYFPLIVTILFIFMVAFEVIVGLVYLITNANTNASKNSLSHFIVASLIYLGYVTLTYLKNKNSIDWDIFYLNPFLLFFISSILGIWSFKNRSILYDRVMRFSSQGGLLYLMLGTISFATIGYFFATANDPFIEVIEDAIIFGHLSFGLFFVFYVIANFWGLLKENLQVYKVLYKPQTMPVFAATLVSLIGVGGLFLKSDKIAMSQAISGYNNGLGDVYLAENNSFLAEQYYIFGMQYAHYNHRSNYSLAILAALKGKDLEAMQYFDQALIKNPSPHAYANLANLYTEKGMFFDALFSLKEGATMFPNSGELMNNLGVLYSNTSIVDSAVIYMNLPDINSLAGKVASTNMLALLINKKLRLNSDSLSKTFSEGAYIPAATNLMALFNRDNQVFKASTASVTMDSILNLVTFSHLYNQTFNNSIDSDTSLFSDLDRYINNTKIPSYAQGLNFAKAHSLYKTGAVSKSFMLLDRLQVENSQKAGYYNNVRGLWAMEQNSPRLALDFFDKSEKLESKEGAENKVLALLAIDSLASAKVQIAKLEVGEGGLQSEVLQVVKMLLEIDSEEALLALNDREKYWYLNIYQHRINAQTAEVLIATIDNKYFYALANYERQNAGEQFSTKNELDGLNDLWKERIFIDEMDRYATEGNIKKLREELSNPTLTTKKYDLKSLLYQAMVNQADGKIKEATSQFRSIAGANAFDEVMTIESAQFFQNTLKDEMLSYNTLLNAVTINPYSPGLKEQYILQCLNMRMIDYAAAELEVLGSLLSGDEFNEFKTLYNRQLVEIEKAEEVWGE